MRSSRVAEDVAVVSYLSPVLHREERPYVRMFLKHSSNLLRTEEVEAKEVSLDIEGGKDQDCCQDAAACEYHTSCKGCYVGHRTGCWTNTNQDQFPEMVLSIISYLLTFSAVGGFAFTQMLTRVGSDNQILKHTLLAFKVLFAVSFFCNFLAALVILILQHHREYSQYKKISLFISNTASFAFLLLGYGSVIAFNIQHR